MKSHSFRCRNTSITSRHLNNSSDLMGNKFYTGWTSRVGAVLAIIWCLDIWANADAVFDEGIRGVVKAQHEALLSVDIRSYVKALPVRPGGSFSKGDLLISFDCVAQLATADASRASYNAAKSRYESSVEMNSYDALGGYDVDLARAEMDEAAALARGAEALTRQCQIVAPYEGRVAELAVNTHEMPAPNTPLMKIVGTSELELRLIVPSGWLNWLTPGVDFQFEIDETGKRHKATVISIGAEVDAVSRTVPIIATFDKASVSVLPGMSGIARFDKVTGSPGS